MDQGLLGILLFLAIVVSVAVAMHRLLSQYWLACIASVVIAEAVFFVVAFMLTGFIDPLWPIALVTSLVLAVPITMLIGRSIRKSRRSAQ